MKLLIIDDSELIRSRLTGLLQDISGVDEIQTAGSLADTLWRVQMGSPDLLILDIHLLDGNAIQSIETLRKGVPDMRIAMLSNDATAFNRKKCLKAGADWFFDKSTEFEQVVELVRNLVGEVEV